MTLGVLQLPCDIAVNQRLVAAKPLVAACFLPDYFHVLCRTAQWGREGGCDRRCVI